jgi:hypothetical protein
MVNFEGRARNSRRVYILSRRRKCPEAKADKDLRQTSVLLQTPLQKRPENLKQYGKKPFCEEPADENCSRVAQTARLEDHERRLIRIETWIEISQGRRRELPKAIEALSGLGARCRAPSGRVTIC